MGPGPDAHEERFIAIARRLDEFQLTVDHTLSDEQCCVEGYQERMDILGNGLGMVQTELQHLSETLEAVQQDGPPTDVPRPPEPSALRPERAAGDRRRATVADPDVDETASAIAGSYATVQELVEAVQTSQKEDDNT